MDDIPGKLYHYRNYTNNPNSKQILPLGIEKMIIHAVSDLHGNFPNSCGASILVVAGDMLARGSDFEVERFEKWLSGRPYAHKIVIAGNHDNFLRWPEIEPIPTVINGHYLQDSGMEIDGIKFWGTPWTYLFPQMNRHCRAFTKRTDLALANKFSLIPNDIDVLISHGPFRGTLDLVCDLNRGKMINCGSKSLFEALKRVQPRIFICGHIHEQFGQSEIVHCSGKITRCYNVSHCNADYKPVNPITEIVL